MKDEDHPHHVGHDQDLDLKKKKDLDLIEFNRKFLKV